MQSAQGSSYSTLAELIVAASMEAGEFVVIQTKQVKKRNVQIANVMDSLGGF